MRRRRNKGKAAEAHVVVNNVEEPRASRTDRTDTHASCKSFICYRVVTEEDLMVETSYEPMYYAYTHIRTHMQAHVCTDTCTHAPRHAHTHGHTHTRHTLHRHDYIHTPHAHMHTHTHTKESQKPVK